MEEQVPGSSPTMAAVTHENESRGMIVEETRDAAAGHTPQSPFPGHFDPEKVAEQKQADEQGPPAEPTQASKKPLSFYLAFLSLLMMVLIVSLDSTILAVALPVSRR